MDAGHLASIQKVLDLVFGQQLRNRLNHHNWPLVSVHLAQSGQQIADSCKVAGSVFDVHRVRPSNLSGCQFLSHPDVRNSAIVFYRRRQSGCSVINQISVYLAYDSFTYLAHIFLCLWLTHFSSPIRVGQLVFFILASHSGLPAKNGCWHTRKNLLAYLSVRGSKCSKIHSWTLSEIESFASRILPASVRFALWHSSILEQCQHFSNIGTLASSKSEMCSGHLGIMTVPKHSDF